MINKFGAAFFLFFAFSMSFAQEWTLRLNSHVEIRSWKLTTKAEKEEKSLGGASITLYKGTTVISKTVSDAFGDFTLFVPANAEFILTVSYPGYNTKKFAIITTGVPENIQKDNFKPTFSIIGGFIMAKPFPGIDYAGLEQPLVKIVYKPSIKNFDDDESYTDVGRGIVGKITEAENILINKFCSTNKAGDVALAIPDCPLAKKLYNEAIALIPGEQYPVIQLAKVGLCLKDKEEAEKKAAEAAAAKAEADRLAEEKKLADKANAEKAAAEKAEADRLAKEKAAADKAEADKLAKEKAAQKAEADKVAKEKAAAEKKPVEEKIVKKKEVGDDNTKSKPMPNNEKEEKKFTYETGQKEYQGELDKGNSDHKIHQVLGGDKYKENLKKAEEFFKMKRWSEAKTAYEEALKSKAGDTYCTGKLAEIEKKLNVK